MANAFHEYVPVMKRLVQNRMQSDGLQRRRISKMPEQKQFNRRRVLGEEGKINAAFCRSGT
jgi:hypothetical protein